MKVTDYEKRIKRNTRNTFLWSLVPFVFVVSIGFTVLVVQAYRQESYQQEQLNGTVVTRDNVMQLNEELHMQKELSEDTPDEVKELLRLLSVEDLDKLSADSETDIDKINELINSDVVRNYIGSENGSDFILPDSSPDSFVNYMYSSDAKQNLNYLDIVKELNSLGVRNLDWSTYEVDSNGWLVYDLKLDDKVVFLEISYDRTGILDWHIIG